MAARKQNQQLLLEKYQKENLALKKVSELTSPLVYDD